MIQSKPSEKGEIITYLSRMGDVLERVPYGDAVINAVDRVHAVVDGNEPHIVAGEDDVSILAYSQVVTTEAAEVFAEPAAYQALFDEFKALLYAWALEIRTGITVIHQHFQVRVAMISCVSG